MRITVDVPDYDGNSLDVIWDREGKYNICVDGNSIVLSANREALISFAKQFLYFTQTKFPEGSHIHIDSFFCRGLSGVYELVVQTL